jgi:hypothetical protein
MSLNSRLRELEQAVGKAAKGRGRSICSRYCTGASWEGVLQMIEESLLPESGPVLKDIDDQIEEYSRRPPRKLPNGEITQDIHGFMYWLWDLQEGNSSLPEIIPPELLLAWRNGYTNHPDLERPWNGDFSNVTQQPFEKAGASRRGGTLFHLP